MPTPNQLSRSQVDIEATVVASRTQPAKSNRMFLFAGVAILGLLILGLIGGYIYRRHRAQAHVATNSLAPNPANNAKSPGNATPVPQSLEPASTPELSIEEQLRNKALELGEAFLDKHIVQCGDSFYWRIYRPGRGETLTYEAKDKLNTAIEGKYYPPKQLSQAEKLNGADAQPLEWSGYITIHFSAGRLLAGTWQDNSYVSAEVNRCKGKWYVNAATFPSIKTRSPYGAAELYGIPTNFEPNDPMQDKLVEIECDK